ncbi:MAG: aldehyde ferredoxin oxidoreductase family protein [Dehalococcoidales bacterium]|jgi:aldehyde:ferredoxin oxidoreductase|nr:aldehyde ferredoxin oxidoreductase family protein [Dehalococcoidales bacterium]
MYGWTGQRLKVYLTEGKIVKEPLSEELKLNYLGGRGLNSKTLFDELKPGIDPLSPDNIFMVGGGPVNGTAALASARWTVTAKSTVAVPGGLADGNGGGDFATKMKFAGYDQIVFYGRSPKPIYLWIDDDHVELRDASHLWGRTNVETNKLLWEELGDREVRVLSIGPAGENLVRLAKVFSNITRAGGKGGVGAVMGSKNLKAVAVRGTGSVKIARPAEFLQLNKRIYDRLMVSPANRSHMETGSLRLMRTGKHGNLTTRNAQSGWFEGWEKLSAEAFHSDPAIKSKHRGCSACPISCSHYYEVTEGPYASHGESPEYGTTYPLSSKLGIDNLLAVLRMHNMCDELGLDTHSTGGTLSFAMHCWQEGLLTLKDTDGIDLSWGNADGVIELLPKIANREGFGNVLADGSYKASQQIKGSEPCLLTVKGMEVSALYLGPGTTWAHGLAYATSTRGADHLRGFGTSTMVLPRLREILGLEAADILMNWRVSARSIEGKGIALALNQDQNAFVNSLELCGSAGGEGGFTLDELGELVSTTTGVKMTGDDLMKIGERIYNVEKAFNIREGMGRKDDTLPQRFFTEEDGPRGHSGMNETKFQKMLDDYYQFRGWDHEGIPTVQKLEELGLSDITEQIGAARG